jgi:uncharacterized protein YqjF (DUF2071 family)
MEVKRGKDVVRYSAQRTWPDRRARYRIEVTPGERFDYAQLAYVDLFLTARYRLYSTILGRLAFAQIEHEPWPLAAVRLNTFEQWMVQAAGLPAPGGDPLMHFSEFVKVRIGRPQFV